MHVTVYHTYLDVELTFLEELAVNSCCFCFVFCCCFCSFLLEWSLCSNDYFNMYTIIGYLANIASYMCVCIN